MMTKNSNSILPSSGSIWLLLLGVMSTTLYFNIETIDPFNTSKLIIILLLSGWLLGYVLNFLRQSIRHKEFNNLTFMFFPLAFICSMGISLYFTDVFIVGLIGETQRRNGFLSYLALTIILLFAAFSMNFAHAVRLLKVALLTGLALSVYGLLQVNGKDFVSWNNPYNSMISTLGNPNFASAMLAIFFLIATFSLFIRKVPLYIKMVTVFLSVTSIFLIIQSDSRQGLLVIFFGIIFYVSVFAYLSLKKSRALIVLLAATSAVFVVLGMLQKGPLAALLYKDSVSVRGFYWRAGYEMFVHQPLTGVGLDRYGAYFKEFREVGYPLRYGFSLTSSNAHNTFIQFFATGGIFVGLAYLLLVLSVLLTGLRLVRRSQGDERKIALTLLTAWVGFQAQSLISIDNIGVSVWGWLLSGTIFGLNLTSLTEKESRLTGNDSSKSRTPPRRTAQKVHIEIFQPIFSAVFIIPFIVISFFLYQSESQSYLIRALLQSQVPEDKEIVEKYAKSLYANNFADPTYKFNAALALVNIGKLSESKILIDELRGSDPKNLEYLNWLAMYEEEITKNYTESIKYRNLITLLDPWDASNYLEIGKLYKKNGNLEGMNSMLEKIMSFAAGDEIAQIAKQELG
jgi:O-antigen ligase